MCVLCQRNFEVERKCELFERHDIVLVYHRAELANMCDNRQNSHSPQCKYSMSGDHEAGRTDQFLDLQHTPIEVGQRRTTLTYQIISVSPLHLYLLNPVKQIRGK